MAITTISSREFNQDTSKAKRAARKGPVFITNRGKPSLVVLNYEDYQKMSSKEGSILDRLYSPEAANIEFDPPRLDGEWGIRPADFS